MGRCPTGGGKKTSSQKNRVGYATKRLRRSRFELPHADVIYKAVHGHLKTGGNAKKPGAARELSSMEAMIKGDPNQPFNEDLPGGGQFYDMFTGRHFESKEALERHMKTKQYKRDKKRVLNGPAPHEQRDAEAAAGMGAPDNGKKRTHRAIGRTLSWRTDRVVSESSFRFVRVRYVDAEKKKRAARARRVCIRVPLTVATS